MMVSKIQEPLSRINGVGNIQVFGSQYAMRIWVDPMKLNSYQLTMADVTVGRSGAERAGFGRPARQPARAQRAGAQRHRLGPVAAADARGIRRDPAQDSADGSVVRLRDVARVELGAENYGFSAKYNGHPATGRRHPPRARRQRARDDRRGQGEDRRDLPSNSRPT